MTMTIEDEPETDDIPSVMAIASDCEANRISIDAQGHRIDALQARMDARFRHVDDRMNRMEARMEARFRHVDDRMDRMEARMDAGFDHVDDRMNRLEAKQEEQGNMLAKVVAWVEAQPKLPKKRSAKK